MFFLVPLGFLAYQSLQSGTFDVGYAFSWAWGNYWDALQRYNPWLVRSLLYAGLATVLALVISYPLAYWIAFRGGRWKNLLLIMIIAPFFVTYLIRTLAWETILADQDRSSASFGTSGFWAVAGGSWRRRPPSWRGSPTTSSPSWPCRSTCRWSRSTTG